MFKAPFSFDGRIRRTEFGLSFIIYTAISILISIIIFANSDGSRNSGAPIISLMFHLPALIFLWAQGAKRCHDVGSSGWMQIIPFYMLYLTFADGEPGTNQYGDNPKGQQVSNQSINTPPQQSGSANGYQGGNYNGGHNNPNSVSTVNNTKQSSASGEYQSGSMYN